MWLKILVAIDQRNQIIQARKATINVEVDNLKSLVEELKDFRLMWPQILEESSLVAKEMEISTEFPRVRKRKRYDDFIVNNSESIEVDDEVENLKQNVFYVISDSVIDGLNRRFVSVYEINNRFSFLWNYLKVILKMLFIMLVITL